MPAGARRFRHRPKAATLLATHMIDKDLLLLLVCPESRQPLALAEAALLARVNAAIDAGRATNAGGVLVKDRLEAGLVRQDLARVYPVRENIPVLLVEEGIPLAGI